MDMIVVRKNAILYHKIRSMKLSEKTFYEGMLLAE